ncbi:hypothetical protein [Aureimonas sp. AU4]|uniref:hypothetical protein n=1 Tax=Aureimonas sp. AU4 TaxID=1638163 RepID=UPI000A7367A4|nr:hypothetical protein [Aureimonas sp. AU4]
MSRLPPGYEDEEREDAEGAGAPALPPLSDPLREAKMQVARAVARRRRAALAALKD